MAIMMDENEGRQPDKTQEGTTPYTPISEQHLDKDACIAPPAPVLRQKKKRTVSASAVIVIAALCIVATFMTTYVFLSVWYIQGERGWNSGKNGTFRYIGSRGICR